MVTDTARADPVGFVGLGQMGSLMAARLLSWPGGLVVHDLRPEAMAPLADQGARTAASPAGLRDAVIVGVIVLDDAQVVEVAERLLPVLRPGTVLAIHSTGERQRPHGSRPRPGPTAWPSSTPRSPVAPWPLPPVGWR